MSILQTLWSHQECRKRQYNNANQQLRLNQQARPLNPDKVRQPECRTTNQEQSNNTRTVNFQQSDFPIASQFSNPPISLEQSIEEFCRIEATVQHPQNVTMITSDTKSDEQNENSGKFEIDVHPLVNVAVIAINDTKSDEGNIRSSDQIEIKDIQSSQNVTMSATSDTKSDKQSVENSGKFKIDVYPLVNVTIIAINDAKSDEDNVRSSDQIEIKDIQSSQNVKIIATSDAKLNKQSAENSDKVETEDIQLLASVAIIETNDTKSGWKKY